MGYVTPCCCQKLVMMWVLLFKKLVRYKNITKRGSDTEKS